MAKKVILESTTVVTPTVTETVLESAAISIVPRGNKKYDVVKVMFNADTLESGKAEILHSNVDVYEARHLFKILAVNLGMFN